MARFVGDMNKDWAAQERLCRKLGVPLSKFNGNRSTFHLWKVVLSFLSHNPWYWYRLFSAVGEYRDCKLLLLFLEKEAEKIRTTKNQKFVESILFEAGKNLVNESREDWPELIGLFGQKLAHLGYYDEFYKDKV